MSCCSYDHDTGRAEIETPVHKHWRERNEDREREWQGKRAKALAEMDPKAKERAHTFLDTLMVLSSPNDMIGLIFVIRAAFNRGVTAEELLVAISDYVEISRPDE